jgi:glycosyltransferase involved in cell wall biosynthesis
MRVEANALRQVSVIGIESPFVNRIRVVAILEAKGVTGPAKNLLKFAADCRDKVDLTLVTFQRIPANNGSASSNHPLVSEARKLNIAIEVVPETSPFDLTSVNALRKIFQQREAQIVETHGTKSHFLVSLLWRRQFSWIAFHHGYTAEDIKIKFYQHFDRWSLRRCDSAVTVCEEFAALLEKRGVRRDRIHIVHNAVESNPHYARLESVEKARRHWNIKPDERVVLSVGRLSPEKGHADLVEAASRIVGRSPAWKIRVIIAGSGPCEKRLKDQADALGLKENVELVGHQSELHGLFAIADVFVLPSLSEGSPNVLLESMAAGVPIISTRVGGVPELLKDSESAILVAPADKNALAVAILELLMNRPLANRLAGAAFERVQVDFSPAKRHENLLNIYAQASNAGQNKVTIPAVRS